MYKLLVTGPGWLRILWRHDAEINASLRTAMEALAAIPGISLYEPGALELPCTTWMLPEVQEVAARCRVHLPALVRNDVVLPDAPMFEHQVTGAQWLTTRLGGGLLADAMGLGKTRQAAIAAEALRTDRGPNGTVIILGPMFARDVWLRELLAAGVISDPAEFCALASRDLHHSSFHLGAKYYYCHYDIADAWWGRLHSTLRPRVAIADEAHWVRNGRAKRSKATMMVLGTTSTRFVLTGTPIENRPSDLWHLLTLASGTRTWGVPKAFRVRYCGAVQTEFGLKDGEPTNVAELRARMVPWYLRRTVESAGLSLPAMTRSVQLCAIDKIATARTRELLTPDNIALLAAAIASGMVQSVLPLITQLWKLSSAAKLLTTAQVINNALEQGESVVVFVWQKETARQLASLVESSFLVTGDDAQPTRDAVVASFQTDGFTPMALIATYGALREGVTLHRSRTVILHDLHWAMTTILQAEARIHRIGQRRACQAIWMIAPGTIDGFMAPLLSAKAETVSTLLDQHEGTKAIADLGLLQEAGAWTTSAQVEHAIDQWSSYDY